MLGFQQFITLVRSAIDAVKDLDASLTELQKVADLSGGELEGFVDRAFEAAGEIGRTGTDLVDATAEFRRAGYDMEGSFNLGKTALLITNIGVICSVHLEISV